MTIVLLSTLLLTNFITVLSRNFVINKEGFDAATTAAKDETATTDAATDATGATTDAKKPVAATTATAKPVIASTTASGVTGAGGASNKTSKKVAAGASSTAASVKNQRSKGSHDGTQSCKFGRRRRPSRK